MIDGNSRRAHGSAVSITRRSLLLTGAAGVATALAPGIGLRASTTRSDVLVIGAGLAGLNATMILEDIGANVTLIEGRNEVGGRVRTAKEGEVPGHPELGASGIGGHYASTISASKRFGLPLVHERPRTDPRKGELMYHIRGQNILTADWAEHELNPFENPAYRKMPVSSFQYMVAGLDENPLPRGNLEAWQKGDYAAHDISVYDYLRSKGISDRAIKLGAGTNMSYGSHERDLSLLMGYQNSNLLNSLYGDTSTFDRTPRAGQGGNQRVPEAIANNLSSDILFDQHVIAIRSTSDGIEAHTRDGKVHRARYCICTLPFSALRLIDVDPVFEGTQAEAIQTLGYVPVFQVHLLPKRKYWEADGMPPSMWTDRSPGRFMALKNDRSNPDDVTSCLAFVNGTMARFLDRLKPEDAAELVVRELAEMRPSTKGAFKVLKVFSWNRSPFAGGAYAYWKPGQITRFARTMREPWHRIHLAGEHTAVLNRGMEGAMESGERAAFEVLERLY